MKNISTVLLTVLSFAVFLLSCKSSKDELTKYDIVGLWVDTSEIRLFDKNFRLQNVQPPIKPENVTVYLASNGKCRLYSWALYSRESISILDTTEYWSPYMHQSFSINFGRYVFDSVKQQVHITVDSSLLYRPLSGNPYILRYRIAGRTYPSIPEKKDIHIPLTESKLSYLHKNLVKIDLQKLPYWETDYNRWRYPYK